jgi:hypothetical protein
MLLTDSIKQSIHEIDAFIEGYTLGTLIIEDGQAFLGLSNEEALKLDSTFFIEVITDSGSHSISYKEAIETVCSDGWHLYAGFEARVKKVAENFQLPNIQEMTTVEAIHWYTKQIVEVTNVKHRVAGTYSEAYKQALLSWKKELNRKVLAERESV